MIEVPIPVVVAQWALLIGLGSLVYVMYRQLAYLLNLSRDATHDGGPVVGTQAPAFTFRTRTGDIASFPIANRPAILAFVNPRCESCEEAVRALEGISESWRRLGIEIIIATDSGDAVFNASPTMSSTPLTLGLVEDGLPFRLYHISMAPFILTIDGEGVVRSRGGAVTKSEIAQVVQPLVVSVARSARAEKSFATTGSTGSGAGYEP
jgi:thiol-disulfide isomerase/thioredoxin